MTPGGNSGLRFSRYFHNKNIWLGAHNGCEKSEQLTECKLHYVASNATKIFSLLYFSKIGKFSGETFHDFTSNFWIINLSSTWKVSMLANKHKHRYEQHSETVHFPSRPLSNELRKWWKNYDVAHFLLLTYFDFFLLSVEFQFSIGLNTAQICS